MIFNVFIYSFLIDKKFESVYNYEKTGNEVLKMNTKISVSLTKIESGASLEEIFAAKFGVKTNNIVRILLRRRNVDKTANEEAADEFIAFCATVKCFFTEKGEVLESTMSSRKMHGMVIFGLKDKGNKIIDRLMISTRASDDIVTEYYTNYIEDTIIKMWFGKKQLETLKEEMRHYDIIINDKIYKSFGAALKYISAQVEKL